MALLRKIICNNCSDPRYMYRTHSNNYYACFACGAEVSFGINPAGDWKLPKGKLWYTKKYVEPQKEQIRVWNRPNQKEDRIRFKIDDIIPNTASPRGFDIIGTHIGSVDDYSMPKGLIKTFQCSIEDIIKCSYVY